jgi:putative ABC transport system permease protein
MRKSFEIIWSSLLFAIQELKKNKLRTFLSLLGITFGIFCIISVMATVTSLQRNVKQSLETVGTNTIYIQKWSWAVSSDYPWWKYMTRPNTQFKELAPVKAKTSLAKNVAFSYFNSFPLSYKDLSLEAVNMYGVTDDFHEIQPLEVGFGRYLSSGEFQSGSSVTVIGYTIAEKLFGDMQSAIGKRIDVKGRKLDVIGVINKQGQNLIGGWDFDNIIIIPYRFLKQIANDARSDAFIMVKGKENVPVDDLKNELRGVMRSVRRLSPRQEDNFSLNDVNSGSAQLNSIFSGMTIGGVAITILSFIVGIFGVANIMFVSVRERTSIIGLKKAIGAKRSTILFEFLMESAFLCLMGGAIGLLMVFILTLILTNYLDFEVYISLGLFATAVITCIITGILAGIIPAFIAARMDPVKAIRSK